MKTVALRVGHEAGLHARPAAVFVQAATGFQSQVKVRNFTQGTAWVDAKSILGVLTLGVEQGHEIELQVEGSDEDQALTALEVLIQSNFEGRLA
jgi:phosphotransferase system HPr (HPr) family protein